MSAEHLTFTTANGRKLILNDFHNVPGQNTLCFTDIKLFDNVSRIKVQKNSLCICL